jgi:hypothetical protein
VFDTVYSQVGAALTLLVVLFAFIKGDEPERLGSAAFVIVVLVALAAPQFGSFEGTRWGLLGLDAVLLAVFIGLALHSRRSWLVWASAFQALIVTSHVVLLADMKSASEDAFSAVNNLSNYGLLVSIAVGTFWAWQERRAAGLEG